MKFDDGRTLYARIYDPNGLEDGLNGYAIAFEAAQDREELAKSVGSDLVDFYVEAPNAQCAGWRYEDGQFIEP